MGKDINHELRHNKDTYPLPFGRVKISIQGYGLGRVLIIGCSKDTYHGLRKNRLLQGKDIYSGLRAG